MLRYAAASVRGPDHVRRGLPNQDAWSATRGTKGTCVVVADGVGSRRLAALGSRAATWAARRAWGLWSTADAGHVQDLVRLVEVLWRLRIGTSATEAATTCLLAIWRSAGDGDGVLAQLGDGLVGVVHGDGHFEALTPSRTGFGSETLALGASHRLSDWSVRSVPRLRAGEVVLLATDGIADDLETGREGAFISWLRDLAAAAARPGMAVGRVLREWPVPGHSDDKTVALVWEDGQ